MASIKPQQNVGSIYNDMDERKGPLDIIKEKNMAVLTQMNKYFIEESNFFEKPHNT